ncbi:MAG: DeoR/GlpR transcriptional regulator [Clostridia bacterium]|nr:DeoR/GlpR transcriptional regulator [Clostridia bacterium]
MNQARRKKIVELLEKQGAVTNGELMETFGISIETVRRDLAYLEKCGLLDRVYGGAVQKKFMRVEPNYDNRENKNSQEKTAIAKRAGDFIEENESVFFDIGTTALAVAQNLSGEKSFKAFTNSLRAAIALSERDVDVTLTGGSVRKGEHCVSGGIAEETMRRFNIDKAFIGAAGVDENGVTDFIPQEAFLRKQVIDNARKVIVLADYSKFGVRAACNVCPIEEIDVLITDEKAPKETLKKIQKKGVTVVVVK